MPQPPRPPVSDNADEVALDWIAGPAPTEGVVLKRRRIADHLKDDDAIQTKAPFDPDSDEALEAAMRCENDLFHRCQ